MNRPTTPAAPSLARRPTVPVTTPSPGFRSVVGTASADISFDLDYNNDIRSGKRINSNSASKEEFERLQVGEKSQVRSLNLSWATTPPYP